MGCCSKNKEAEDEISPEALCEKEYETSHTPPFTWHPSVHSVQQISYVRSLECKNEALQSSLLNLTSQMARLQFHVRQITKADPRDRSKLINDLERIVFKDVSHCHREELPSLAKYNRQFGDIKKKQHLLIQNLRCQIGSFKTASNDLLMQNPGHNKWEKDQEKNCYCPDEIKFDEGLLPASSSKATSIKSAGMKSPNIKSPRTRSPSIKSPNYSITDVTSKSSKSLVAAKSAKEKKKSRKSGGCENVVYPEESKIDISAGSQTDLAGSGINPTDSNDNNIVKESSPSEKDLTTMY